MRAARIFFLRGGGTQSQKGVTIRGGGRSQKGEGGLATEGRCPPLPCVIIFLHTHNIWSSILYVWIRCEPRSLQVTLSVCLFVAYFEQTTSCARSCMNELINDISWLFPSKMTPHKGLCAFLFIKYALCNMHYALCIMHYALCLMHYASCIK